MTLRRKRTLLRQLREVSGCVGTAVGTAAVTYTLFTWGLVSVAILWAHEWGHYAVARALGLGATLPLFVPLGIIAVGFTRVYGDDPVRLGAVGWAGPATGLIVAATFAAWALLWGYAPAMWFAMFAFGTELWNLCFGTDQG